MLISKVSSRKLKLFGNTAQVFTNINNYNALNYNGFTLIAHGILIVIVYNIVLKIKFHYELFKSEHKRKPFTDFTYTENIVIVH